MIEQAPASAGAGDRRLAFTALRPGNRLVHHLLFHVPGADPGALPDDGLPQMAGRVAAHRLVAGRPSELLPTRIGLFGGYGLTYGSLAG